MKKSILLIATAALLSLSISSCQKYRKYDNMEVVENTYAGTMSITSTGTDPAGDFTGADESGIYAFIWDNSGTKAQVNFDFTSPSGSVSMILEDAKGDEVLNASVTPNNDTYSGTSSEGKSGKWKVLIQLDNVEGDGSFSINPIQ